MKCRNCATEISEKALICYRCGEATSAPRIAPPPPPSARGPLFIIALIVLIAVAVLVLPQLMPGTPRLAGWAALVIITALTVWRLRPRSRQRFRRSS